MNFPLQVVFKVLALAPQIYVRDRDGNEVCYVKQKLFKLKEKVQLYTDSTMRTPLGEIAADRILDFSANYTFVTPDGQRYGSVRRKGMRSLWRAHYEITEEGGATLTIRESNPWTKMVDGIFGELPLIGLFSGYFFHPRYDIVDAQGARCFSVTKRPAFLEGRFEVEKTCQGGNDLAVVSAIVMMLLLERSRG